MKDLLEIKLFVKKFIDDRFMGVVGSVFVGEPRTFTCWYIYLNGNIYWKSRVSSEHSRAFLENKNASMCIYDHKAEYPDNKTGIQLLGKVEKVTEEREMQDVLYSMSLKFGDDVLQKNKMEDLLSENTNSTFYRFTPNTFKLVCKEMDLHMENYENFN